MQSLRFSLTQFAHKYHLLPSAIFLLALFLNLYRINAQSLWEDEAFSVVISRLPLVEMTSKLTRDFVHPPLYYYLLHLWLRLFGVGAIQARLLSALFGTGSVVVMYFLGKFLFRQRAAALAALILAGSQLGIMYSQEARPYAPLLFFVLCSIFSFLVMLQKKTAGMWCTCIVFVTLMIYTHYYGLLVAAFLFLFALYRTKQDGIPAGLLIGGVLVPLLSLVPWLSSGVIQQALQSRNVMPESQPAWFEAHWWSFLSAVNHFNNGKLFGVFGASPWWTYVMGTILFTAPALFALKPLRWRTEPRSPEHLHQELLVLLSALWLAPLAIVVGLGVLGLQYDVRYVAFCAAPYYLLVAEGISRVNSSRLRRTLLLLILVYSLVSLRSVYFIPYKEDYRGALAYLAANYEQGDCGIFLPSGSLPSQWSIYQRGRPDPKLANLDGVLSNSTHCERIWLVTYRRVGELAKKADEDKRRLEVTCEKVKEMSYHWVDVGLYVPRK
jgi:4-amino-4-deoxy-L-arabinose transferase-like glycosyltransferase